MSGRPDVSEIRHDARDDKLLASFRAQSMKTCATGLTVRFFSVATATGHAAEASLTGKG